MSVEDVSKTNFHGSYLRVYLFLYQLTKGGIKSITVSRHAAMGKIFCLDLIG